MIRLTSVDITASQMGAESLLNTFFGSQFEDTSYLDNLYDTVSSALIEAGS